MARGGKRPGAGRPKGAPNKATRLRREILEKAHASGLSPLEVMISAMRQEWDAGNTDKAVAHAAQAAPYVHPRLASTDIKVDDHRNIEELSTAELLAIARSGNPAREASSEAESDSLH